MQNTLLIYIHVCITVSTGDMAINSPHSMAMQNNDSTESLQIVSTDVQGNIIAGGWEDSCVPMSVIDRLCVNFFPVFELPLLKCMMMLKLMENHSVPDTCIAQEKCHLTLLMLLIVDKICGNITVNQFFFFSIIFVIFLSG